MNPHPTDYWNIVTLGFIASFGLLSAALIVREGRLGWALFCKNVTYALAFGFSALSMLFPVLQEHEWVRWVIRLGIILSLMWAMFELVYARYLLWRQNGMDPRVLIGRRELVVGKREVVATRREDVVTQRENCMDGREEPCE